MIRSGAVGLNWGFFGRWASFDAERTLYARDSSFLVAGMRVRSYTVRLVPNERFNKS